MRRLALSLPLLATTLLVACPHPGDRNHPAPRAAPPRFGDTVQSARPVPPLSGGTLTLLGDGRTAVAADPDRDRIFVADLVAGGVEADLALTPGDEPGRSVEDATGTVHVVLRRAGALLSLRRSGAGWDTVARRPVCAAPRGIAYDVADDLLHVACAEGKLVSLPAAGGEPVRELSMPLDLRDVVVSKGVLYVSRFRAAEILVVGRGGAILQRLVPPAQFQPGGMSTAAVAWRMRPHRDGGVVLVHQYALVGEVQTTAGGYGGGGGSCAQLMETAVTRLDDTGFRRLARMPAAVLPIDVALSPERDELAVVAAGNAHTQGARQLLLAPASGDVSAQDCQTSEEPREVSPDGQPRGEAVAVELGASGQVVVQTREPAALELIGTGKVISLSRESRADTGHAIFHATAGSLLACASCHPDGGDDGHVWTFAGLGTRRTQSLRGGVSGSAPFHWNGDLRTLGELYQEVLTKRMAGPALDEQQQRALTRFIDGIPALPESAAAAEPAERGRALFESAAVGCAACHGGPAMTNNLTVDVGTGGRFQTPSLRGVRWRAPYLHDGCAPALAQRFGACGGGDRHGRTSHLSSAQLADLIAYLETL